MPGIPTTKPTNTATVQPWTTRQAATAEKGLQASVALIAGLAQLGCRVYHQEILSSKLRHRCSFAPTRHVDTLPPPATVFLITRIGAS